MRLFFRWALSVRYSQSVRILGKPNVLALHIQGDTTKRQIFVYYFGDQPCRVSYRSQCYRVPTCMYYIMNLQYIFTVLHCLYNLVTLARDINFITNGIQISVHGATCCILDIVPAILASISILYTIHGHRVRYL